MAKPRPLSPHLQVYRPQLTSVMSIMHRASGAVLATGSLLVALWLVALAAGAAVFNPVADAMQHPLGQLVVFRLFAGACLSRAEWHPPFNVGFAHWA